MPWWYLATLLVANLALLLPNASPWHVVGALLLIGLLPGLSWVNRFLTGLSPLLRWTTAAALSYSFTSLATLLLYYLPGPVQGWQILVALNLLAILPFFTTTRMGIGEQRGRGAILLPPAPPLPRSSALSLLRSSPLRLSIPLLLILLIALLLRTLNLDYSEFQGDESLAMIATAEALEGHEDALFLRSKGPGEVLLPMALWRLTGVITEPIARWPFTIASLLAVVTIYLIGQKVGGQRVGWLAAGFFAFNGFMVAFGRIVQYQALVIWLSALAFLLILEWREIRQLRLVALSGLCLGLGLLAHYDAILVTPAIIWLLVSSSTPHMTADGRPPTATPYNHKTASFSGLQSAVCGRFKPALLFIVTTLLTALPFYLPFALDPQANRTGDYVGGRIGSELRNNLPDFFHFNTFYSSSYYLIITGLLILGLLIWLLWQTRWGRWLGVVAMVGILALSFNSTLFVSDKLNLSILPFAVLLAGAFFARPTNCPSLLPTAYSLLQSTILWLAVPFLGYNFVVALGLTHIYTIVPAWSLLAGLGWHHFFDSNRSPLPSNLQNPTGTMSPIPSEPKAPWWRAVRSLPVGQVSNLFLAGLAILSTIFLRNAFIRHDVEYWQDYPAGNLPLYWTPYDQPPSAGFFGFAHRAGWKTIGQKIAAGELAGDYSSNEEPDVTTWYTRGAPRACDPQPEFYFLADDLIDPVDVPSDLIASTYEQIGQVILPNQKQMRIMQLRSTTLTLGELADSALARDFDQTATPAAFARSVRGSVPIEANFSHLVRLIGYDLDPRRAHPGGRLPVTLYWQTLAPIPTSYQIFTHLESESGPVAQADGIPVCWSYPTDRWRPGQIIADQHAIQLPPEIPPGDYPLQVGLYVADTLVRLDVLDRAGNPAGTSVTLTIVEIRD